MGIMEIGTRALQANQVALQTAGNNIANVNTIGYSRQTVILQTVPGQFTGGGYIGKGVAVQTIQRNYSEFLTRQATLASATASADITRADKLKQLEGIFEGGPSGLGAAINDMMNSFADVASAPTDLTARTVTLTRIDETAARMRAASQRLDDLQIGVTQELTEKVNAVNSLAKSIGEVNNQIAKVQGQGQPPNDLLDRRDQLISQLNKYVQTTTIPADDGTLGIFLGGSQALVLGTSLLAVVGMARAGTTVFWKQGSCPPTSKNRTAFRAIEALPAFFLLVMLGVLTVAAGPATAYADATSRQLFDVPAYVGAVLGPDAPGAVR